MTKKMMTRLLIFHPAIAPYRIKFFNCLFDHFKSSIVLSYRNLKSQKFNYENIEKQFHFQPEYASKTIKLGKREFYLGTASKIREYNPDTIIVSEYGESLWEALINRFISRKKYKIIVLCDDSLDYARFCAGLRKISRNLALRWVNGLILCNDTVEDWYKEHYKIDTHVFPILQDEKDFFQDEELVLKEANELVKQYQLEGKRVYLFVGRLSPEKNIEYLIRSFIDQHEHNKENVLFIVGGESDNDPSFTSRMKSLIERKGAKEYITFTGRKEGIELKAWYAVGTIFVLPSKAEPFGSVVNEALLSGEYVMVSDRAGSACLVTPQNGELFDIGEPCIHFDRANAKVKVIQGTIEKRDSMMPFTFEEKMNGLLTWIEMISKK